MLVKKNENCGVTPHFRVIFLEISCSGAAEKSYFLLQILQTVVRRKNNSLYSYGER